MEAQRKSVRWIRASVLDEGAFAALQERIRDAQYRKKVGTGYLIEEMTAQKIRATYVERKVRTNDIIDPFGGIQHVTWFEFITYPFAFERRSGVIEIACASRGLSPLIRQFGLLTNWKAAFEPLLLEPSKMLEFLASENARFDVICLDVAEFTLSTNSSATIRVTGKTTLLKDLRKIVGERKYSVSRVMLHLVKGEQTLELDISLSGKVVIEGASPDEGISLCRRAISWALETATARPAPEK